MVNILNKTKKLVCVCYVLVSLFMTLCLLCVPGLFKEHSAKPMAESVTAGIALQATQEGNSLYIETKSEEEIQKDLQSIMGENYAQAGETLLPTDATILTVDFMRQFSAVAGYITNITISENISVIGDAYFSEQEQRYIGVFDAFTALQNVTMSMVDTVGSYAFFGCEALQVVTTNVETLSLHNLSVRNAGSMQIQGANLHHVMMEGTWGTVRSEETFVGGVTQADLQVLPKKQVTQISFLDQVAIGEQALLDFTSLEYVQATNALSFDISSYDFNQTNLFTIALRETTALVGNPYGSENVYIDNISTEDAAKFDAIYMHILFPISSSENDLQYFTFTEYTYYEKENANGYLYKIENLGTEQLFADYLYVKNIHYVSKDGANYLSYIAPVKTDGSAREDVSTLFLPKQSRGVTFTNIEENFAEGAKNPLTGSIEGLGSYAYITNLMISGEYTTVGTVYKSYALPALETIIFADGITNIYNSIFTLDVGVTFTQVWLPNTLQPFTTNIPTYDVSATTMGIVVGGQVTYAMHDGGTSSVVVSSDGSYVTSLDGLTLYLGNNTGYVPEGVEVIALDAFSGKNQFPATYQLPNSVTTIFSAFKQVSTNNASLMQAYIPSSVTYMYGAFENCAVLESVTFADNNSLQTIFANTFAYCTNLQSVQFEGVAHVQSIETNAFAYCDKLLEIAVPSSVVRIEDSAFTGCTGLKTIYNYSALSVVAGQSSFGEIAMHADAVFTLQNKTLVSFSGERAHVVLPEFIHLIGANAFLNISTLQQITFSNNLQSVDATSFLNCSQLQEFIVDADNAYLESKDGVLYTKGLQTLVRYPQGKNIAEYTLLDSVQNIGAYAFYGCTGLSLLHVAANVLAIENNAFENCTNLQTVYNYSNLTIESGASTNGMVALYASAVYSITDTTLRAFSGTLTDVVIPNFITAIGSRAFYGNTIMQTITFHDLVTHVYADAFLQASALRGVYIQDMAKWCAITFANNYANPLFTAGNLYVNRVLVTDLQLPENVARVSAYTFAGLKNVTSLSLPNSVTTIGVAAFENAAITEVRVSSGLTQVEDDAFKNCKQLAGVYVNSLEDWLKIRFQPNASNPLSLGADFYVNSQLTTELVLPESTTAVLSAAFYGFKDVTKVTMYSAVQNIENNAFVGCDNLQTVINISNLNIVAGNVDFGAVALHATEVFTIDASTYYIKAFSGTQTNIVLPDLVKGIQDTAFSGNTSIVQIVIPSAVTEIMWNAFQNCSSLQAVTFAENSLLSSIGNSAFNSCTALTTITIPQGVTYIGWHVFYQCTNLTEVTLLGNITTIDGFAFASCSALQTLQLQASPSVIGESAFANCAKLSNLFLISAVTSIGVSAFTGCTSLTNVTLPNTLTSLGASAFANCSALQNVSLSNALTNIANDTFADCVQLQTVSNMGAVASIGANAFTGCTALTNVSLSGSLQSIANNAFYNCTSLKNVYFASSANAWANISFSNANANPLYYGAKLFDANNDLVTNIFFENGVDTIKPYIFYNYVYLQSVALLDNWPDVGTDAFYGCVNLKVVLQDTWRINIKPGNSSNGYVAYYADIVFDFDRDSRYITDYTGNVSNLIIPEGVYGLDADLFNGYTSLQTLTIPSSMKVVSYNSFQNCTNLTAIYFTESATQTGTLQIQNSAFEGCTALQTVEFSNIVGSIGWNAFRNCSSICWLTLPSSLTVIEGGAFEGCTRLAAIINHSPLSLQDGSTDNGYVAYYAGYIEDSGDFEIIDGVYLVETNLHALIRYYGSETSIVLPSNIPDIYYKGFYLNTNIQQVTVTSATSSIGDKAFEGCVNLHTVVNATSFDIEAGLETYGYIAYYAEYVYTLNASRTTLLKFSGSGLHVVVPQGAQTIASNAFENNTTMLSIVLPSSLTSIETDAFVECINLAAIENNSTISITLGASTNGSIAYYAGYIGNIDTLTLVDNTYWLINNYLLLKVLNDVAVINNIPQSVTAIARYAFYKNTSVQTLYMPSTITQINDYAFYGCTNLTTIYNYSSMSFTCNLTSDGYVAYYAKACLKINPSTNTITSYNGTARVLEIPEGVVAISANVFKANNYLSVLTLPSTLTTIGETAFQNCLNLGVIINNSALEISLESTALGYIGYYASYVGNGSTLTNANGFYVNSENNMLLKYIGEDKVVVIPNVTSIARYAFYYTLNRTSVTIPDSVTDIYAYAFSNSYFTDVYYSSLENWLNLKFYSTTSNPLYYAQNLYFNTGKLEGTLTIPGDTTEVLFSAFINYKQITAITFSNASGLNNITKINNYAFYGCSNVVSVTFLNANKLTSIGEHAFRGCTSLTSISIPYSVTSIGNYAFYDCSKLKTVTLTTSSNLTYIGLYSFYNCSALTSIMIPSGVTVIEEYAFANCSSLQRVTHESNYSSLHTIARHAFENCTSLVSFTITRNVTDIDEYAFSGCSALAEVVFLDTSGWYWATSVATETGFAKDVTDSAKNAEDFTSILYRFYYWNKR